MGCDIHMAVEVKRGGKWTFADVPVYGNRNYDLFGMLANVHNGHGFAGVVTGEGWPVISEPRGFPADADPETLEHANGDHSASWLLAAEVLDYFKAKHASMKCGVITYAEWTARQEAKRDGAPDAWCGDIKGPNILVLDEPDAKRGATGTHVRVEWKATAAERAEGFIAWMEGVIGWQREHRDGEGAWDYDRADDVRLVFNFDS